MFSFDFIFVFFFTAICAVEQAAKTCSFSLFKMPIVIVNVDKIVLAFQKRRQLVHNLSLEENKQTLIKPDVRRLFETSS